MSDLIYKRRILRWFSMSIQFAYTRKYFLVLFFFDRPIFFSLFFKSEIVVELALFKIQNSYSKAINNSQIHFIVSRIISPSEHCEHTSACKKKCVEKWRRKKRHMASHIIKDKLINMANVRAKLNKSELFSHHRRRLFFNFLKTVKKMKLNYFFISKLVFCWFCWLFGYWEWKISIKWCMLACCRLYNWLMEHYGFY